MAANTIRQGQAPLIPSPAGEGAESSRNLLLVAQAVAETQEAPEEGASSFKDALLEKVEEKHDQIGRLEGRLENLVERQLASLVDLEQSRPGRFSRSRVRLAWEQRHEIEASRLVRSQSRLEKVREIRDGLAPAGPTIEDLAFRKLRHASPELVDGWIKSEEARRRHVEHFRLVERQRARQQGARSLRLQSDPLTDR